MFVAAPSRLRFRGNEHARFPGHGGHPPKRNESLEPGRYRAATRAPGGERRAPGLHAQCGVLARARLDDAGVGGLSRRTSGSWEVAAADEGQGGLTALGEWARVVRECLPQI